MADQHKPNFYWSILSMRCPRCRRGDMFSNRNPWRLRKVFDMPKKCSVCGQPFELEVGFWYGTAYVSYALSIALSVASFVAWFVLIGMSTHDDRFFAWLGLNIFLLIFLQPWLMRLSRVIYLNFFVKYNPNYKQDSVRKFDYDTKSFYEEKH